MLNTALLVVVAWRVVALERSVLHLRSIFSAHVLLDKRVEMLERQRVPLKR